MIDLAKYARIYDPSPEDAKITKGEAAIKESVTQLKKVNRTDELIALGTSIAAAFAKSKVDDPIGNIVAAAIKKHSPAFVRDDRGLELLVCSAVACMETLSGSNSSQILASNDLIAATIWSALAYQQPLKEARLEQLRQDLLAVARSWCEKRAEQSRIRVSTNDVPEAAEGDAAQVKKSLTAASAAITGLRSNAVLDREEIDMVWWALGTRSFALGVSYDSLSPWQRSILCGIELGTQMRRLPAEAHRHLALNRTPQLPEQNLAAVLGELEDIREDLVELIPSPNLVETNSSAFPLLHAIVAGTTPKKGPILAGDDWCARALLETSIASLCQTPNSKV